MDVDIHEVIRAARAGGTHVMRHFNTALETEEKSSAGDLRTKADIESEQAIITILQQSFPTVNIYAEENGRIDKRSDFTFVVDPLDGTHNFTLGIPDFAISIGLLHKGEAILGVIYNPVIDQLFTAEKGKGAFMNDTKIHVNQEADLSRSTIGYTCGYDTPQTYSHSIVQKLRNEHVVRIVEHWAPAYDYCLLACGRLEAIISKEGDLEDYVAAKVIIREAGGVITDFSGKSNDDDAAATFIATNQAIHSRLLALLT